MRFTIGLTFHGDLPRFLKRGSNSSVKREFGERTSIKDVIESCGIPHTEADLILVDDKPVDFARVIDHAVNVDIFPISERRGDLFLKNRLQSRKIAKFVADGHLGKLVRDLRLLGIDVIYDGLAQDRQLVDIAKSGERALLTRDRPLLMHASVRHGYYLRSQNPLEQTREVLRRFDLMVAPFTRCLRCNALLQNIDKPEIIDQLEPLTKIYYQQFRRCAGCRQIYWSGSHFQKLEARVKKVMEY